MPLTWTGSHCLSGKDVEVHMTRQEDNKPCGVAQCLKAITRHSRHPLYVIRGVPKGRSWLRQVADQTTGWWGMQERCRRDTGETWERKAAKQRKAVRQRNALRSPAAASCFTRVRIFSLSLVFSLSFYLSCFISLIFSLSFSLSPLYHHLPTHGHKSWRLVDLRGMWKAV